MSKATLITIPFSHYCEKARWALELAGVDFEERGYLPGLSRLVTARYGGTTVPLLVADGLVLKDSTEIVGYADRRAPREEQRLLPTDSAARDEALSLEDRFDKRVGVASRAWAYSHLLNEPERIQQLASAGVSRAQAMALGPLKGHLATLIRKGLRIGPTTRAWGAQRVDEDLAFVGERLADGRRFLLGDRLTVADIAFATLSAPALLPPEYGAILPTPESLPREATEQIMAWRATAGGQFALRIYREHRRSARRA
jgi:glutathione S-transferase